MATKGKKSESILDVNMYESLSAKGYDMDRIHEFNMDRFGLKYAVFYGLPAHSCITRFRIQDIARGE